jgi:hypothetical protein
MTSQQFGDSCLAEHRAVMEVLHRECIKRVTMEQYEAVLSELREVWSCPASSKDLSA